MRSRLLFLAKLVFTATIVGYIFHRYVDWRTLEAQVSQCSWIWLAPLVIHNVAFRFITARQIEAAFVPYGIRAETWPIMRAQYVSSFYSLILPGDIAAGAITWRLLSKHHGQPIHVGNVLIFMRLLNLVALIPFVVLGVWVEPGLAAMQIPLWAGIASLVVLVVCLPFVSGNAARAAQAISETVLKLVPWAPVRALQTRIWQSVHLSNQMSASFKARLLLYALVLQVFSIVRFWMLSAMVGLTLPWSTGLWIVAILAIIHALPLTIGGLGVRELTLVILFQTLYGVPPELSVLFSAMGFAIMMVFTALPGAFFIFRRN